MAQQFDNIITDEESQSKLLKIISRRIMTSAINTLFDTTAIVSTPFIINEIANNVSEEYAKDAIKTTGTILFMYELNRGLSNIKMTKFLLQKRDEILTNGRK